MEKEAKIKISRLASIRIKIPHLKIKAERKFCDLVDEYEDYKLNAQRQ